METITQTEKPAGSVLSQSVTAEQINQAFELAVSSLKDVAEKTREFVIRCVTAGELLKTKRAEFPPRAGWYDWLEKNCPDVSRRTCDRLIHIANLYRSDASGMMPALPDRLSSVEDLYLALKGAAEENAGNENTGGKSTEPAPSRVVAALSRFWGAITRRPPATWDEIERSEFLTDLAEREKIRKENGWDLPSIDVDAETVS